MFGYPTVVRFSNETIQKILFNKCIRVNWFDNYNRFFGVNKNSLSIEEEFTKSNDQHLLMLEKE